MPIRVASKILLAVLIATFAAFACSDPASALFARAEGAFVRQKMEEALALYRSLPVDYPQSRYAPTALLRQGEIFSSYFRNDAAALDAYESLVFSYPGASEVPRALLGQGEIHLLRFFDARRSIEVLERIRRNHARFDRMDDVLILLARAYANLPDPARQAAALSELIERHPLSPRIDDARWMLSYALLAQNKYRDADREFRKLLVMAKTPTGEARARWGLALALEGRGDLSGALAQCEAIGEGAENPAAVVEKVTDLKERIAGVGR